MGQRSLPHVANVPLMPLLPCSALIFDLDGVLIDSNAIYERHWERWAEKHGVDFGRIATVHHGRPAVETIREVAPHLDAKRQAWAYNAGLVADRSVDGVRAFDGVDALLQRLPQHQWAIATSAPREFALSLLHHLRLRIPPVFISSDDVERGKPAPDPYVLAARRLGQPPSRCVVIEDAPAGVASATAAGARVIALCTTNHRAALQQADAVVDQLSDLAIWARGGILEVQWRASADECPR